MERRLTARYGECGNRLALCHGDSGQLVQSAQHSYPFRHGSPAKHPRTMSITDGDGGSSPARIKLLSYPAHTMLSTGFARSWGHCTPLSVVEVRRPPKDTSARTLIPVQSCPSRQGGAFCSLSASPLPLFLSLPPCFVSTAQELGYTRAFCVLLKTGAPR